MTYKWLQWAPSCNHFLGATTFCRPDIVSRDISPTWYYFTLTFCRLTNLILFYLDLSSSDISPTWYRFNLKFWQLDVLSNFCHIAILSTCSTIRLLFHQFILSSNSYFVGLLFYQLSVSSNCCNINIPFHNFFPSNWHSIKFLFHMIAILSTFY